MNATAVARMRNRHFFLTASVPPHTSSLLVTLAAFVLLADQQRLPQTSKDQDDSASQILRRVLCQLFFLHFLNDRVSRILSTCRRGCDSYILPYQIPNACHTHCLIPRRWDIGICNRQSWSKEGCGYTTAMGPLMRPIRPRNCSSLIENVHRGYHNRGFIDGYFRAKRRWMFQPHFSSCTGRLHTSLFSPFSPFIPEYYSHPFF